MELLPSKLAKLWLARPSRDAGEDRAGWEAAPGRGCDLVNHTAINSSPTRQMADVD